MPRPRITPEHKAQAIKLIAYAAKKKDKAASKVETLNGELEAVIRNTTVTSNVGIWC